MLAYFSNVCNNVLCTIVCAGCRDKRIVQLTVDNDLVTGVTATGATTLDTDGHLWIGRIFRILPTVTQHHCPPSCMLMIELKSAF